MQMANGELPNAQLDSAFAGKKTRNLAQELQSVPKTAWKRFSNSPPMPKPFPQPRCLLAALLSLQLIVLVIVRGFPSSAPWIKSRPPQTSSPSVLSRPYLHFSGVGLNLDSAEQRTVENELKWVEKEESLANDQRRIENGREAVENDQRRLKIEPERGGNEQKTVEIEQKSEEADRRAENDEIKLENEHQTVQNEQKAQDSEPERIKDVQMPVKNDQNSEILQSAGDRASETMADRVNPDLVMPSADNSSHMALRTVDKPSSPSGIATNASKRCDIGRVFVYELPSVFNSELLENCETLSPWFSLCPAVENFGFGQLVHNSIIPAELHGAWYSTDQFTSEIIFHQKMLVHPCRTEQPELATAFYVPFYAGLSVGRYLWSNYTASDRDRHGRMMLDWLVKQKYWRRNLGLDHFLMLGRITWDFRRSRDEDWGSSFVHIPEIHNTTRLAIERNPWDENEMGVPYPTAFHPRNTEDVVSWQEFLRNVKRNTFFSFAGAARKSIPNDFRGILLDQCREAENCRSLNCAGTKCSKDSLAALELFLDSSFCLQPRGDSFTRRSIFDCLIAGSIPVFFWHRTAYWQYKWHLPSDVSSYSVFISKHDVRNGTRIENVLKAIDARKVQSLRETIIENLPRFVYADPRHHMENMQDAFDISVDGVLKRINSLSLNYRPGVN